MNEGNDPGAVAEDNMNNQYVGSGGTQERPPRTAVADNIAGSYYGMTHNNDGAYANLASGTDVLGKHLFPLLNQTKYSSSFLCPNNVLTCIYL